MRVEIVEEVESEKSALAFPPGQKYLDLRENPRAVERISAARRYLPLRNFLSAVNSEESIFTTASAAARSDLPAAVSAGLAHEFAFQTLLVFAEPSLNFERKHYEELISGLKELLERDPADAVRTVLRISSCDFRAEKQAGFCLGIRLVAQADSALQAELRCGLALARVQQALLFRARSLKQQTGS
jgi:hypothetical protein